MKHHLFQYEFCATKNQKSRSSIGHKNICNSTKDQLDFKLHSSISEKEKGIMWLTFYMAFEEKGKKWSELETSDRM